MSMAVLPPPTTHTGVESWSISPSRMSQKSGETERTAALPNASAGFVSTASPLALISRSATTVTALPVGTAAHHPHRAVDLLVAHQLVAEQLDDGDVLLDLVEAVLEVIEHLGLVGEVVGGPVEGPPDVARGEEPIGLVQPHVVVGVQPHAAHAVVAIDEHRDLVAAQVLARHPQRVEPGDPCTDDTDVGVDL